jgi:NOL1/NOP2/fmu family ribosome biogenesis protein
MGIQDDCIPVESDRLESRGGKAYLVPELPEKVSRLHFLRNGLLIGEFKKNRFEPSQAFAMTLSADLCGEHICLRREDERVARYLRGETIQAPEEVRSQKNGWKLICVDQFSLGWGKLLNGVIKNKYLPAWRKN